MEFCLQLQPLTAIGILFAAYCLWMAMAKVIKLHKKQNRTPPPEPSGAWPIIGHLRLLGAAYNPLHKTLGAMADMYGPAFSIRIGIHRALVVSSWEVVKECFTSANDKIFSTRPRALALKLMAYDHSVIGFAPYGPYWRDQRKLATIQLLSSNRLEKLKHVRDFEINFFVKEVYEQWVSNGGRNPVLVEMKEKFGNLTMNIVVRIVAGKRYVDSNDVELRRYQKAIEDFWFLIGTPMISDAIPFLGWVDLLNGYRRKMKRSAKEVDDVLESWLEEHRRKRLTGSINDGEQQDFIDVMMSVMEEDSHLPLGKIKDNVIKATCLSMILGGNDTTVITLTWALSLLLNHRRVLRKAQDELDVHVGKLRQVQESDVKNLIYLQAIVKETLRLHPALPMSLEHEAMEDCTVAGFHISAGTGLLVNLWKVHRDPNVWSNPLDFYPERFLKDHHKDVDVRGQHYELIPFGSGRRMCPGVTFALQVLHLTLARLLHSFELATVLDLPTDMAESPGLTAPKATPLEVLLTPRLPSMVYYC